MKQIDSMLLCICSVMDHRRCQIFGNLNLEFLNKKLSIFGRPVLEFSIFGKIFILFERCKPDLSKSKFSIFGSPNLDFSISLGSQILS